MTRSKSSTKRIHGPALPLTPATMVFSPILLTTLGSCDSKRHPTKYTAWKRSFLKLIPGLTHTTLQWSPVDSGRDPYIIRTEDVLEDEKGIVRRHVMRIRQVPVMKRQIHLNREVMLTVEEEEEDHEERFSGPWSRGVYNPVVHC